MDTRRVGQIGLGAVGYHFARHLLEHYGTLVVFDVAITRVERVQALGALPAEDVKTLAVQCDTIVLSLPDPDAVKDVLTGSGGLVHAAKPLTLIIDCSTIDPDGSRWASDQCKRRRAKLEQPCLRCYVGRVSEPGLGGRVP